MNSSVATANQDPDGWYEIEDVEPGRRVIKVPAHLRQTPLRLRINGQEFPLDHHAEVFVDVEPDAPDQDIELVAPDGRVVDYQFAVPSNDMLHAMGPQSWFVGIMVGPNRSAPSSWQELGLKGRRHQLLIHLGHRPGAWGYRASLVRSLESRAAGLGPLVEYAGAQIRFAATFEKAVFPVASHAWRRLILMVQMGALHGQHLLIRHQEVFVSQDQGAMVQDRSERHFAKSWGGFAGFGIRNTLIDNIWLTADYQAVYEKIEFINLHHANRATQHELLLGIQFAF